MVDKLTFEEYILEGLYHRGFIPRDDEVEAIVEIVREYLKGGNE